MKKKNNVRLSDIDALIFDFDGVLTDNTVHVDQKGNESVTCNRSDGLAFDILRKLKKKVYIISTEKNKIVFARSKKLKIPALYGVKNKFKELKKLSIRRKFKLSKTMFIGNDLNDYEALKFCGYSACPSDSHKKIKQIATFVLDSKGGSGITRELIEDKLKFNILKII